MEQTYTASAVLENLFKPAHKHFYRLRIYRGRLVAQCDCGKLLECDEVERVLNGEA